MKKELRANIQGQTSMMKLFWENNEEKISVSFQEDLHHRWMKGF